MYFLIKLLISAIAVILTSYLLPGVNVKDFLTAVFVAALLAILNGDEPFPEIQTFNELYDAIIIYGRRPHKFPFNNHLKNVQIQNNSFNPIEYLDKVITNRTIEKIKHNILAQSYPILDPLRGMSREIKENIWNLFEKCWCFNPKDRPDPKDIINSLTDIHKKICLINKN